ncbi:MAG: hypothetical protein SOV90_00930 [Lachnospiraceae bacterium]|nr:hypothetical protein [Clostridiales bacterium]MDY2606483.1 hypothetical protein [Lachnospiraceae bacterium]
MEEKKKSLIKTININKIIKNIGMEKLLIIAICGVVLVMLPSPDKKLKSSRQTETTNSSGSQNIEISGDDYCEKLEKRLEDLISKIDGIGEVKVMITLKATEEKIVLTEVSYEKNDENSTDSSGVVNTKNSYKEDRVVVYEEGSDGNKVPYVTKENAPEIEGIAVIAEGGNNADNVLKISEIAQALFGISSHKISVIGMR